MISTSIKSRNVTSHDPVQSHGDHSFGWEVLAGVVAIAAGLQSGDWIASGAILVLWAIWRFVPKIEGPPALPMALTYQWLQVVTGVFYLALTGRHTLELDRSDYRPMVLIGLSCVLALLFGLRLGARLLPAPLLDLTQRSALPFRWRELTVLYIASVVLTGSVEEVAWRIGGLTQIILAVSMVRLVILFLLLRRLAYPTPRFGWIGIVLVGEVALGFTGFFANFKEPLLLTIIAFLEIFDRRKASHWLAISTIAGMAAFVGFLWLGIRTDYRKQFVHEEFAASRAARAERLVALTTDWTAQGLDARLHNLDVFVMRLWAVYYPALAVQRVPVMLPHEDGALLWGTIKHVLTPRLFFAEKDPLVSNSTLVRRYSGVRVAGEKEDTSIAFGYAAESYVDFGVPLMFIPVLLFGFFTGAALQWFLLAIRCREAAIILVTVLAWSGLYLFEVSWSKMLGDMLTRMIFLGGAFIVLDRLLNPSRLLQETRNAIPRTAAAGHPIRSV